MTERDGETMIIANIKVFFLFLIVDIISNCQIIIIDNYTKTDVSFLCEMNIILMISTNDNCSVATKFFQDG
jgi:hypothetical protein